MARRAEHQRWGMASGIGVGVIFAPKHDATSFLVEVAGAAIGGLIGGTAADVLEPATTPNHRAIAHSGLAVIGLGAAAKANWAAECHAQAEACRQRSTLLGRTTEERQSDRYAELWWRLMAGLIIGFLAGYASHLMLDSNSKRGLPLLGMS